MLTFVEWLETTAGSTALRESLYMYPLMESVHVWALVFFVGFAAVLDLRLLGMMLRAVPVTEVTRRLLPWTITGFVILVITGVLLFYANAVRTYTSIWFRGKMLFLVLAGINVWVFHSGIYRRVAEWNLATLIPRQARMAGALSLALWTGVIFAGRMIAYTWFDCDQPQRAVVRVLAGCPDEPTR